ncbi:MAG: hypothetical protein IJT25_01335 [Clostridia bacterium]|nr:hypothetical protein [Clostridia bacterium]
MKNKLKNLAKLIGWQEARYENGVYFLEYILKVSEYETLKNVLTLSDIDDDVEFLDVLGAIISVLPKKLKKTIFKLVKHSDLDKKDDLLDLVSFTIEEYIAQSDYTKLNEYAGVVGISLDNLGYSYSYELTKKEKSEILSKIESVLPLEILPQVGKMKKIEYKIGFVKTRNAKIVRQAEE